MIAAGRRSKTSSTAFWISSSGITPVPKVSMNTPTGAEVSVAAPLFQTLAPTTRSLELSGRDYLLTDTVGFIGGVENDLIKKFEAGFTAGVAAVNPDIEVLVNYISQPPDFSGFNDPAKGKEIAAA